MAAQSWSCGQCNTPMPDLNAAISHQYDQHPTDAELIVREAAS